MVKKSEIFINLGFCVLRHATISIKEKDVEMARRWISIAKHYLGCAKNMRSELKKVI